ncbi:hypothetical protein [Microcoleus vaginatus]|uniref:hypothetical protein n=1 Tax=Microcoleus vaginatus TaxID=119532 RepID=UPI00020D2FC3|nr:hypothetical protein MicvaDRAFT_4940 [Microcoleus vaginatus FGP-2]
MSTPSYSPSKSPFLDRIRHTILLNHLSRRTEKSYLYCILDESRSHTFGDRKNRDIHHNFLTHESL